MAELSPFKVSRPRTEQLLSFAARHLRRSCCYYPGRPCPSQVTSTPSVRASLDRGPLAAERPGTAE